MVKEPAWQRLGNVFAPGKKNRCSPQKAKKKKKEREMHIKAVTINAKCMQNIKEDVFLMS